MTKSYNTITLIRHCTKWSNAIHRMKQLHHSINHMQYSRNCTSKPKDFEIMSLLGCMKQLIEKTTQLWSTHAPHLIPYVPSRCCRENVGKDMISKPIASRITWRKSSESYHKLGMLRRKSYGRSWFPQPKSAKFRALASHVLPDNGNEEQMNSQHTITKIRKP